MKSENIEELTKNEELELEKNLIWLFGYPNYAVNLLSKQLSWKKNFLIDKPQYCKEPGVIKLGLHSARTSWEWRQDPDYFFSKRYIETWKFYLRRLILNRIYSQFNDFSKKIIINEPEGVGASTIISKTFPKSTIIFLVEENLSSVIDSFSDDLLTDRSKLPVSSLFDLDKNDVNKIVTNRFSKFKKIIMETYDFHSKQVRYMVKFEDLISNSKEELKKIYKFLGIKINENELEKIVTEYSFENLIKKHRKKKFYRK